MGKQAAIKGTGSAPSHLRFHREKAMQKKVRWAHHRGLLAETKREEKRVRASRKAELVQARDKCQAERKAVTVGCKVRRDSIRTKANKALLRAPPPTGGAVVVIQPRP